MPIELIIALVISLAVNAILFSMFAGARSALIESLKDQAEVRVKLSELQDENHDLRRTQKEAVHMASVFERLASDEDREWCKEIVKAEKVAQAREQYEGFNRLSGLAAQQQALYGPMGQAGVGGPFSGLFGQI